MLEDNIKIKHGEGEYKDFPYKYSLYLYGKCVWTDDFHVKKTKSQIIDAFIKELKECDLDKAELTEYPKIIETKYFNDYDKAVAYAEKHNLKECEYGETGYMSGDEPISYCAWNKSGSREDEWEIEANYTWKRNAEGRYKPAPISKEWIKHTYGVEAED